jgi:uncharacterized membrane protein YjgN (DUF898 family)
MDSPTDGPLEYGSIPAAPTVPQVQTHRFEFTGSAQEFFRIWIVNFALSVVTLGLYSAWAKVRARQYLYSHTLLDGHPFEYLGNPIALLKGNLIVGAGFLFYSLTQQLNPVLTGAVLVIWFVALPFLIHQSLRFTASNSAWRNIRFRFHGTLGQAYVSYLLLLLLLPFTLGILFPYVMFRQRQHVFGNAAYGTAKAQFSGESGAFYGTYIRAGLMGVGLYLVLATVGFGFIGTLNTVNPGDMLGLLWAMVPVYLLALLGFTVVQQYIFANIANYSFANTHIPGRIKIVSSFNTWELIKLRIVNFLATVCTLGLLAPWAKIRYLQYVFANLSVVSYTSLDEYTATVADKENALGDAATDFFNIEIGL